MKRKTGKKRDITRNIESLFSFRHSTTNDHIFEKVGLKSGNAREKSFDQLGTEIIDTCMDELTFRGSPHRTAYSSNNDSIIHNSPISKKRPSVSERPLRDT